MKPFRNTVACAVLFAVIVCCGREIDDEITAGLFELRYEGEELHPLLTDDSMSVPFDLGPWESWGFFIRNGGPDAVEVYAVLRLPAPPRRLGGEWAKYSPDEAVSGMRSEVRIVDLGKLVTWGLHDDDPLGEYAVEVFVDGSSAGTLRYTVAEINRPVYRGQKPRTCSDARLSAGSGHASHP